MSRVGRFHVSSDDTTAPAAASPVSVLSTAQGGTGLDTSAETGIATLSAGAWSFPDILTAALGGTGQDSSGSTGLAQVSSGTWGFIALAAKLFELLTTKGDLAVSTGATVQRKAAGANEQSLVADSTQADGLKWADRSRVLDRDVTTAEVVNTTDETTVYSFTVPGGTLGTNRMLRLTLIGDYLNNSGVNGRTIRIRVKYGGTQFAGLVDSHNTGATRYGWSAIAELSAANATNAQIGVARHISAGDAGVSGGDLSSFGGVEVSLHNAVAVDSTADQTLLVTIQNQVMDANFSGRLLIAQLELL